MKKTIVITALFVLCAQVLTAGNPSDLKFTTVKANPVTSVKNQHRSGTCWAFSSVSFLESEVIRINGITDTLKYPDFSEFFVVSHSYMDRAVKYVRLDGALGFSAGSECGDFLHVVEDYGIVPQGAMTGMQYGTELPVQGELDAVLKAYVGAVCRNPNKTLTTAWKNGFKGILDAYLGPWPESFTVDGKEYTPATYRDALGVKPENYVSLTSFTHHPFYKKFPLELADNWRWDEDYNIPIDELMETIDAAINAGYTVCWGADVSQNGFDRQGHGLMLRDAKAVTSGSDQEKWVGKDNTSAEDSAIVEAEPTQESRQFQFDNKTLTDDHGMQIFGIAKDQNGKKYYMVKNSWGVDKKAYAGIWYISEAFVKGQTIDVILHKDALSKELKKKLSIQ